MPNEFLAQPGSFEASVHSRQDNQIFTGMVLDRFDSRGFQSFHLDLRAAASMDVYPDETEL
jgi:hypothetical protein